VRSARIRQVAYPIMTAILSMKNMRSNAPKARNDLITKVRLAKAGATIFAPQRHKAHKGFKTYEFVALCDLRVFVVI
jgi:hypothetical protein